MRFTLIFLLVAGCGQVVDNRHLDAQQGSASCATKTECVAGDDCCPSSCNATNDSDCQPKCGNGVVEMDETCDGNCPNCAAETLTCFTQQVGSAATCDVQCHQPLQTCAAADRCCPFVMAAAGASCNTSNDSDCRGTTWQFREVTWVAGWVASTGAPWGANQTLSVNIYGIDPGDSVLLTTCTPNGLANTADTVISQVLDNNGAVFAGASDDTVDPGALPRLAGWNCTSTASGGFPLSTAPANPGGAIIGPNVFRLTPTWGGKNGAAGAAKLFIWWNGTSTPNAG